MAKLSELTKGGDRPLRLSDLQAIAKPKTPEEIEAELQRLVPLSLIHISEPTRPCGTSRMPSSA